MANNRNNKARKNTGLKVISVMLAGLTAAAGVACGIGWAKAVKLEKQVNELIQERDENAEIIPMSLSTYGIVEEDYAKYGIPERATNSKLIVADFTPTNTTDTRCNWTLESWDEGVWEQEGIAECVYFQPAENHGASCTLAVLNPFSTTLRLTCTSVANPKIKSYTRVEYVERYSEICNGNDYQMAHFKDAINIFSDLYTADGDWGSVEPDSFEADVKIIIDTDLFDYLREHDCDVATYVEIKNVTAAIPAGSAENNWVGWWVDFNALHGEDVAKWCLNNKTDCIGYIEVTIRCYYKDELIYEFNDEADWCLTGGCLAEMAVPPQGLHTPPEVVF